MRRLFSYAVLFLSFVPFILNGQTTDLKQIFLEADSYFLFEEYSEALPLYLKIHREDPDNDDINYKIGVCYLNDPFQKEKSIRYLLEASENISLKYKENSFKERFAPQEAIFYLGKAYLVNNQEEEAIKQFNHFLSIVDEKIYDTDLIKEQIDACNAAIDLKKKPVDMDIKNLGSILNTRFSDINPVVSGDEKSIVYVSKLQFYDAAFYSTKENGEWTPPRNIVPELGVDGDVYPTALSYNGKEMYIYRNDDFVGNLYVSHLVNGVWTALEKLGEPISTKYWESHASVSRDGKSLYFTSNRKDGYGGLDIYMAERMPNGSWGNPVNLGPKINSRLNEETPFISDNGKILFFSSYGHYNMGGYDIFYSEKDEYGQWSDPVNLGYPINTTDDDYFFQPVRNGQAGYISIYRPEGFGRFDLYHIDLYSVDNPRTYVVSGYINGADELGDDENLRIYLIDTKTGDTITLAKPQTGSGSFEFSAPQGIYNMIVKSDNYNDLIRPLKISSSSSKDGITLPDDLSLTPKPVQGKIFTGRNSHIIPEDTLYFTNSDKPFNIKLKVEKESELTADRFNYNNLLSEDSYTTDSKKFTYTFVPEPGTNRIEFKMVEPNGDISTRTVIVERTVPLKDQTTKLRNGTVTEQQTVVPEKDYTEALRCVSLLKEAAGDKLKDYLADFDPEEAELASSAEVLTYLRTEAGQEEFTANDVDLAAAKVIAGDNPLLLKLGLSSNTEGKLKEIILTADSLLSVPDLMTSIRLGQSENEIPDSQLNNALGAAINLAGTSADHLLQQLIPLSSGKLKDMLTGLYPSDEGIYTERELIDYLKENIAEHGISLEELDDLLARYIAENDILRLRQFMLENSSEGLREALLALDLSIENITTSDEFMNRLRELGESNDFDEEDLFASLRKAVSASLQAEKMYTELLGKTDGQLKAYLESLNIRNDSVYSVGDLVSVLFSKAGDKFQKEELIKALSSLIYADSPQALLEMLMLIAPDKYSSLLELAKEHLGEFSSIDDLIRFLLEHAEEFDLSEIDIWELLLSSQYNVPFTAEDEKNGSGLSDLGRIIAVSGFVAGTALLLIILFIWYRRRKKNN